MERTAAAMSGPIEPDLCADCLEVGETVEGAYYEDVDRRLCDTCRELWVKDEQTGYLPARGVR